MEWARGAENGRIAPAAAAAAVVAPVVVYGVVRSKRLSAKYAANVMKSEGLMEEEGESPAGVIGDWGQKWNDERCFWYK